MWVSLPPDIIAARLEEADPGGLVAFPSVLTHDGEDEDPYLDERTAYVRADHVSLITPLGRRARTHLTEALGDTP